MPKLNFRSQFHYSFVKEPISIYANVSFGASGAPTLVAHTGMGIDSITRVSAGVYNILLSNTASSILGVRHTFSDSAAPASPSLYISSNTSANLAAPVLQVTFNAAGTATDPASGELVLLEIKYTRSSVGY